MKRFPEESLELLVTIRRTDKLLLWVTAIPTLISFN